MATRAEGHRRRKNKSKKKKAGLTTVHDLPEHLLERIIICLGPSPCLVRAAAVCRRWCRVVADAGFLARLRAAHVHATVVGYYHEDEEQPKPVFAPSSLAVDRRRFSLDSFPGVGLMNDSRGSLLLLVSMWKIGSSRDLMVCEPLTGGRQRILWPSSALGDGLGVFHCLVDNGRHISMSNFRILSAVTKTLACVFSSGSNGGWRLVRTPAARVDVELPTRYCFDENFVGRVNGLLYFGIQGNDAVLVLDETTAKFSAVVFPVNIWGPFHIGASRVIGGGDGVLRIVRVISNVVKIFKQGRGGDSNEWVLEKQLELSEATVGLPGHEETFFEQGAKIVVANADYILMTPLLTPATKTWLFSVELDTMQVENEHERNKYAGPAYPYELPWPPVLPDHSRGRRRR